MSKHGFLCRVLVCGFCLLQSPIFADPKTDPRCAPGKETAETFPAKVNLAEVSKDLLSLKEQKGRNLINVMTADFDRDLRGLFEQDPKKISKLEQFFGLLFYLAKYKSLKDPFLHLEVEGARKLLLSSKVFSTPDIPKHLSGVSVFYSPYFERATYEVKFDVPELIVPLNKGKGFAQFREGLCQVAENLIFYGGFNFMVNRTSGGHVYVSDFTNFDLSGQFGARGTVDVDLKYVSVKSVEFLKGSNMGIVRAKISKREFKENDHSWLLEMVSKFVTDKSTQPIDW